MSSIETVAELATAGICRILNPVGELIGVELTTEDVDNCEEFIHLANVPEKAVSEMIEAFSLAQLKDPESKELSAAAASITVEEFNSLTVSAKVYLTVAAGMLVGGPITTEMLIAKFSTDLQHLAMRKKLNQL